MPIRTVLCILNSRDFQEDLEAAVDFCSASGAHLTAAVICLGFAVMDGAYGATSVVWLEERQREVDELGQKTEKVREFLSRTDLSYDVQEIYTEYAFAQDDIAQRALYADIVLIGRQAASDDDLRKRIIGGTLFQTPTPIIINRGQQPLQATSKSVLLAWDSSDEASRAARQALDILKAADCVYVTMIDPDAHESVNGEEPGADIATFLARHGVKVQVDRVASGGNRSDDVIRQHAMDVNADLIVMGAYNHPRWQQTLFGGVTRSMIENGRTTLFLSH
ncbi:MULTISPECIES: universal stress protein [unclassified Rhizobium]|uniref:universal stress protein n=1 Tax=unclassified Rhizobium TaxID=2613769 RepID=UPI0006F82CEE|nr:MULTISPECIES: universal stress protein [unclassified Rhizobium]KQV39161.1 universal stress protein [Rhizobium sp. Root1212]KRD35135.1 universal stress protein [Rhizobium sp. Root268]